MRVTTRKAKNKEREPTHGQMALAMLEIGLITRSMAKESTLG